MQSFTPVLLENARAKADLLLPKAGTYAQYLDITRWYRTGVVKRVADLEGQGLSHRDYLWMFLICHSE